MTPPPAPPPARPPAPPDYVALALRNPVNVELLRRLPELGLPDCHLTAGALFQTVWNLRSGRAPGAGVKDYDVFYFDDRDLSWEAEDAVIRRAQALCADLGVAVELRNQARVHLWYPARFGEGYPRLSGARDGIDRYLVRGTCIGVAVADGAVHAPFGVAEAWAGVLAINPLNPRPALFAAKAESYRARWPWLRIVEPASATARPAPVSP